MRTARPRSATGRKEESKGEESEVGKGKEDVKKVKVKVDEACEAPISNGAGEEGKNGKVDEGINGGKTKKGKD